MFYSYSYQAFIVIGSTSNQQATSTLQCRYKYHTVIKPIHPDNIKKWNNFVIRLKNQAPKPHHTQVAAAL